MRGTAPSRGYKAELQFISGIWSSGEFKYSVYLLFHVRIHLSFHSLVSFYICIVCLLLFFHQFVLLCNLLKIFFHFCTILHY